MKPYYSDDLVTIYHGSMEDICVAHAVVLTDPPYGVEYRQPRVTKGRMALQGDDKWRFPRPDVPFVVWGANNSPEYPDCGRLVWDKERYGSDLYGDGEIAACSEIKGVRIFASAWNRNHGIGWHGHHPTQKPLRLFEWCLGFLPDGTVLDPFMGSGTTLVAAKNLGRKAIGIEIEEKYCEIAAERCSQGVFAR